MEEIGAKPVPVSSPMVAAIEAKKLDAEAACAADTSLR